MTLTTLTGDLLIGLEDVRGSDAEYQANDAMTGAALTPPFSGASSAQVDRACALAASAFDRFRNTDPDQRAAFLEAVAEAILALGPALIDRAVVETGLPRGRIEGERGRTMAQLRLFATLLRDGGWLDARIDPAMPDRTPLPRSDLRQQHIGVGPVAVFGASNFPLAFSVAGGDTAAALAAGCPVVAKAHPAHPGTSELIGRAVRSAVQRCDLPEGVFSLLGGAGYAVGTALVAHPQIKSVGFTGSRAGGLALMRIAAARPEPIPVFAEMSSINPVLLLPAALVARSGTIAKAFIASLTLGAGQFCTNPGLVLALDGPDLEQFLHEAATLLAESPAATMLTPGILHAYETGLSQLESAPNVHRIAQGKLCNGKQEGRAALFTTTADQLLANPALREEVFGAAALVVRCPDPATLHRVTEALEGQLTATLQMDAADMALARELLPALERKAGRILVNGFPTGVEVSPAMVHGGPFPATSDPRSSSVGTLAIRRFLRPVCYQDFPPELLPAALRDDAGAWTQSLTERA
ncbi:MAG: aldehyde dehydrogenase (NADP(+)) [Janthinobacterium lividum]